MVEEEAGKQEAKKLSLADMGIWRKEGESLTCRKVIKRSRSRGQVWLMERFKNRAVRSSVWSPKRQVSNRLRG